MRELALNILDLAQNSIAAAAKNITIFVDENEVNNLLTISLSDDGIGMDEEQVKSVIDPFYTTRTTRKVGLGIPLYKMASEMSGGQFRIDSQKGKGTNLCATFVLSHIDRAPIGDMEGIVSDLIYMNPDLDFIYIRKHNDKEFTLNTKQFREVLDDVPLNLPEVTNWIKEYLCENLSLIK